jgi:hypothetical protein
MKAVGLNWIQLVQPPTWLDCAASTLLRAFSASRDSCAVFWNSLAALRASSASAAAFFALAATISAARALSAATATESARVAALA